MLLWLMKELQCDTLQTQPFTLRNTKSFKIVCFMHLNWQGHHKNNLNSHSPLGSMNTYQNLDYMTDQLDKVSGSWFVYY